MSLTGQPIHQKGQHRRNVAPVADGQRKPRMRDKAHLAFIATLPCVICLAYGVHVAHVRYASAADGACIVGKSEKPSDWRTVPLCPAHHTDGPEAQHRMSERDWWAGHGINPYTIAASLYRLTGLFNKAVFVVESANVLFNSDNQTRST